MSDEVSRVVVGVDGSDGSISAARWAGAVANKFGTSLHLVHSLATTGQFIADAAVIAIRAATQPISTPQRKRGSPSPNKRFMKTSRAWRSQPRSFANQRTRPWPS